MGEPCEIWIKIFVIAFILIAGASFLFLVFTWIRATFTKSGNILYHHQERTIEILKDELQKYKNNI